MLDHAATRPPVRSLRARQIFGRGRSGREDRAEYYRLFGKPTMIRTLLALLVLCAPALARELYPGQYSNVPADVRQWFRAQKSPKTGGLCCNEADGTYAEEDIRNGVYWTRFELTKGEWIRVPPEVVITGPNINGAPVAWWYFQDGKVQIRCYAPGAGI